MRRQAFGVRGSGFGVAWLSAVGAVAGRLQKLDNSRTIRLSPNPTPNADTPMTGHLRRTLNFAKSHVLVVLMSLVFCLVGCFSRTLRDDEARTVAWYVEDLAHGSVRQPGELQLVDASEAMTPVIRLLTGSVVGETVKPPPQIINRVERWSALRALFTSHMVVLVGSGPNRGLIAPKLGLTDSDLSMITPLIDAENNDRRTIDGLIIATAALSGSAVDRYRQQAASARLELDQAAGAVVWQPPAR